MEPKIYFCISAEVVLCAHISLNTWDPWLRSSVGELIYNLTINEEPLEMFTYAEERLHFKGNKAAGLKPSLTCASKVSTACGIECL